MIERVILMCAGRAQRWGNHRGVPKHLVPVNGEKLLDRTLRQIRGHTRAPIVIIAFGTEYSRDGHERFEPRHGPVNFCDTDKFLSSEEKWGQSGATVLLYGDVFFTDPAIKKILTHDGAHQFFGRREGSHFTGCPWRELFAISFPASEKEWLKKNMLHIKSKLLTGELPRGGGWELYEHLYGGSGDHFTVIDDFTDDFDYPHDFERWLRRYKNPIHRALVPLYSPTVKSWRWRLHRWRKALSPNSSRQPKLQ